MEYLISLVLNIVGNLLTPTAKRLLRWPAEPNDPRPRPPPGPKQLSSEYEKEFIRAFNRDRLERAGRILWIHGVTFVMLFAAVVVPLLLKTMPNNDIQLSDTRLAVFGLEAIYSQDRVFRFSLALAVLFYVPFWFLSQPIGHFVATIWDQVEKVSPARYANLIAFSFFAWSLLLAGHWSYVLFPKLSYLTSLALPFGAVIVLIVYVYLNSTQR